MQSNIEEKNVDTVRVKYKLSINDSMNDRIYTSISYGSRHLNIPQGASEQSMVREFMGLVGEDCIEGDCFQFLLKLESFKYHVEYIRSINAKKVFAKMGIKNDKQNTSHSCFRYGPAYSLIAGPGVFNFKEFEESSSDDKVCPDSVLHST